MPSGIVGEHCPRWVIVAIYHAFLHALFTRYHYYCCSHSFAGHPVGWGIVSEATPLPTEIPHAIPNPFPPFGRLALLVLGQTRLGLSPALGVATIHTTGGYVHLPPLPYSGGHCVVAVHRLPDYLDLDLDDFASARAMEWLRPRAMNANRSRHFAPPSEGGFRSIAGTLS